MRSGSANPNWYVDFPARFDFKIYIPEQFSRKTKFSLHRTQRKKCPYSELFWSSFSPHFSAFGLHTERYSVCLRTQSECGKTQENADQNKSEYGHFLRSGNFRSSSYVSDQGIYEVGETLLLPNSLIILHRITLHSLQSGFQESPGHEVSKKNQFTTERFF